MNSEMKNVEIVQEDNIYELFYRVLKQIPIVVTFIIIYIFEYVMTVINIVYGPIELRYNSLINSRDDNKLE